jgi:hypothetical protein
MAFWVYVVLWGETSLLEEHVAAMLKCVVSEIGQVII